MQKQKDNIVNESRFCTSRSENSIITYDKTVFNNVSSAIFSSEYWQAQKAIVGQAKGRGVTWFIKHADNEFVLRHYYRGGVIGNFLGDRYLYLGLKQSRAYQEFKLLGELEKMNLPVPHATAFQVNKISRFLYTNDIIMSRIHNAESLVSILSRQQISPEQWLCIGTTVRRFHDCNVFHHDLNAHNILVDDNGKSWLIDFDKGTIRVGSDTWKARNLLRLQRSLRKELVQHTIFRWTENDWDWFVDGYQGKT